MRQMKTQKPSFEFEKKYWGNHIDYVIGIDEVGRGAFAGPIVAAAVVFSSNIKIGALAEINDSKLLNFTQRAKLAKLIKEYALFWAVEQIDIAYINKYGIGKANSAVFRKVLKKLLKNIKSSNYSILIDGFHRKYLPGGLSKQQGIVKGDQKSLSIAAASILAKVYRDNLMKKESKLFPNYKFAKNKGYGTKEHRAAIINFGTTQIHRSSYITTWQNNTT
ncbi:MAG: hypothetical protein A2798_02540 [Candidatus Levybacteria bacterium RIFCSPHIGHO2_01_FULL_37_17]|nr:MAG: hypothetical protein A2798_02540 [Candidatus Levybacteria bacterium RIFCSPHIGHO2_01_FULL_37_17]OGH36747.1 MAG: hypothetical protein A2959_00530 [Candidatus Levybacteria bacterium RIFCSPLOWO2_01_FULL_38_23]